VGADHGLQDAGDAEVLNNEPRTHDAPIERGDRIEFEPDHIIDAFPRRTGTRKRASMGEYASFRSEACCLDRHEGRCRQRKQ
jgi:hypothetical protein